jgi:4-amino-4-deoxy-L-arabinose transferase-like glycosyltransferase
MTKQSALSTEQGGTIVQTASVPNSQFYGAADQAPSAKISDKTKTWLYLGGIVLLWALIYVPGLASPPMMDDADSEHAQIAREMLQRHDYVTMHVNGVRYLDKAPLPYWLTAVSYSVFGVSEFSARLPLSLFALASLLAVFALGKEIAGEDAGFFSALVLCTAIGPYIYTRFEIPDIMVGFWLILTVLFFLRTLDQPRPSVLLCWGIGAFTACNVLTKGLIGIVFPVVIIGAYLLWTRNLRHFFRLRLLSTTMVFLAIAVPWHVLATLRNPPQGQSKGFFWFYFINEQVYRYLNMRIPRDYDKVPLGIFWGLIFVWLFPWTLFLLSSLKQVPVRSLWKPASLDRTSRSVLLLAIWALVILVFFTFSTRQEYYVLPALPALALLCGLWLDRENRSAVGSPLRKSGLRYAVVMLALGIVAFVISTMVVALSPVQPHAEFADLLKKAPQMYKLSMGHLFDLTMGAMSVFHWPLILEGGGFLAGTFLLWMFRKRGSAFWSNVALAGMMVILFQAIHISLGIFNPVLGSKVLADGIERQYRSGDLIVVDGAYSEASSVNFYMGVPMHMLNGRFNDLWYGSLFPDSPQVFEDDASFSRLWQGSGTVFFIVINERGVERLKKLPVPYYEVAHWGDRAVYTNHLPNPEPGNPVAPHQGY